MPGGAMPTSAAAKKKMRARGTASMAGLLFSQHSAADLGVIKRVLPQSDPKISASSSFAFATMADGSPSLSKASGGRSRLSQPEQSQSRTRVWIDRIGMHRRHLAGRVVDARDPRAERWILSKIETRVFAEMGVGEERDVGDRVSVGGNERAPREMALECLERPLRAGALAHYQRGVGLKPPGQCPEAERAEIGLDIVLLEEEPLHHLPAGEPFGGQKARSLGEIAEDRV